jgi:hypothetical protein
LHAVASLALEYDLRKVRYAANIMLYIPRSLDGLFEGVNPELLRKFIPKPLGLENFEGILLLIDDLAVTSHPDHAPNDIHQDDKIEPVVFGVPPIESCREGVRWTILPGAPLAFVRWNEFQTSSVTGKSASLLDAIQGYDDVSRLGKINTEGVNATQFDVSEHILRAICAYYEGTDFGRRVRSFISFHLPTPEGDGSKAFGVLNIHCDEATFLGPAGPQDALNRQRTFAGIITPIVFAMAEIVYRWWQSAKKTYKAGAN